MLVYAKLSGFPYWPAKALRSIGNQLDVRFFGEYDRSKVSIDKCYWLSEELPRSNITSKRLDASMEELKLHIDRLRSRYGNFQYAPYKTPVDLEIPHVFINQFQSNLCIFFYTHNLNLNFLHVLDT